jgi:hypothetical protein
MLRKSGNFSADIPRSAVASSRFGSVNELMLAPLATHEFPRPSHALPLLSAAREECFEDARDQLAIIVDEKPLSVFNKFPEPPDLTEALKAVASFANEGESFLEPILYITRQIPIDVNRVLSPLFDFVNFDEIPLLEIAHSPLSQIIQFAGIQLNDVSLLLGCAHLVAACACVSNRCLAKFIKFELHSSLFACLPFLPLPEPSKTIIAVLNALTIIWKRLSWAHISAPFGSQQLDSLFSIAQRLSPPFTIPFIRLLHSLLSYGSLDETQDNRVRRLIHILLSRRFHLRVGVLDDVLRDELGQLAEIAMVLSHSIKYDTPIIVCDFDSLNRIALSVHLLPPITTTQFLALFCDYAACSDNELTAMFLMQLPCDNFVALLQWNDHPPLIEATLNILSLVTERKCIEPNYVAEAVLNTIGSDIFTLKRAAIRFVHAVIDIYTLNAIRVKQWGFANNMTLVCDELRIWDIFGKISPQDGVVESHCNMIEEVREYIQENLS